MTGWDNQTKRSFQILSHLPGAGFRLVVKVADTERFILDSTVNIKIFVNTCIQPIKWQISANLVQG